MKLTALILFPLLLSLPSTHAQTMPRRDVVDVPAINDGLWVSNTFQSNMFIQRDKPVHVWGWADPGDTVTVAFAGKTGTAHKPEKGGYAKNKYIASFVGFAPADQPKFVIAVMVDEPSAGRHYGGEVAAPVFAQIANDTLRRMQMSPDPKVRVLPAGVLIQEGT